ncbi:M20/M25/M40 family metallo-hydrolase [Luteimicrobium subarcticum]|uniref:Carboxypeptidase PM20D1 n=1 Tax=Luteimicrobium subarcticum TaxID=620910 RepID=A0A2M8WSL6_9MICO|nr:M20/M25/M40 family metallo-hydrolase [Luteimicrobium subarcticum]PJI93884.1 carboxypeptidase PM20D1 [Luteimicrobium subarcticum]
MTGQDPRTAPDAPDAAVSDPAAQRAAEHLATLVRIPTVSSRDASQVDPAVFDRFVATLAALYPRTHDALTLERVAGHGLLFRWAGTGGADGERSPVVLMAHYDVVPVDGLPQPVDDPTADAPGWSDPPFGGVVRDGVVHGRGTLDDKGSLVVVLEAVEALLADGYRPPRDVYLSFGHNEETAGDAAQAAVDVLRARGVTPWFVLDEGGAVVTGAMPGVSAPTAVVGIAEKGVLDVSVVATAEGGHASTPVPGGAPARLARALTRIDRYRFPARVSPPVLALLQSLAGHTTGFTRHVFKNAGTLGPVVARVLASRGAETNALVRTTVAITQLEGSPGANVLAATARATLNVRVATGDSVEQTLWRLRKVVRDPGVSLSIVSSTEPSPVSPARGPQWDLLGAALGASYPDAVLVPYLQLGASDSRRFCAIAEHVYRFSPFDMTPAQRASVHGVDEHVTVAALGRGVTFYAALLRAVPDSATAAPEA